MQNIGDRLTEGRKRLGVALREASEATKIRTDYLMQMENGTFDFSLPEVYKKGFLKIYARYLKLDADKLGEDYAAQHSAGGHAGRRDEHENLGRVDAPGGSIHGGRGSESAGDYDTERAQNRTALYRAVAAVSVAAVLIVLLVVGLFHLLNSGSTADDASKSANASTSGNSTASGNTTPSTVTTPPPPVVPPKPAPMQLIFTAKGDIANLTVVQDSDHKSLYNASLKKGQAITVFSQGRVLITVSQTPFLVIQTNGGAAQTIADASGKPLPGKNAFYWPAGAAQ